MPLWTEGVATVAKSHLLYMWHQPAHAFINLLNAWKILTILHKYLLPRGNFKKKKTEMYQTCRSAGYTRILKWCFHTRTRFMRRTVRLLAKRIWYSWYNLTLSSAYNFGIGEWILLRDTHHDGTSRQQRQQRQLSTWSNKFGMNSVVQHWLMLLTLSPSWLHSTPTWRPSIAETTKYPFVDYGALTTAHGNQQEDLLNNIHWFFDSHIA